MLNGVKHLAERGLSFCLDDLGGFGGGSFLTAFIMMHGPGAPGIDTAVPHFSARLGLGIWCGCDKVNPNFPIDR